MFRRYSRFSSTAYSPLQISNEGLKLITTLEGYDQPSKRPPGFSGITIGHGYDLGYHTAEELRRDWSAWLTAEELALLATAIGIRGEAAEALESRFLRVSITRTAAAAVFARSSAPKITAMTRAAFKTIEYPTIPQNVRDALCSLVWNRGSSTTDKPGSTRRREMAIIRDALLMPGPGPGWAKKVKTIAQAIRDMKRLWPAGSGLINRREAEARLVEGTPVDTIIRDLRL